MTYKRKLGRPIGNKNKNPKPSKSSDAPSLGIILPYMSGDTVDPFDKGKGKV